MDPPRRPLPHGLMFILQASSPASFVPLPASASEWPLLSQRSSRPLLALVAPHRRARALSPTRFGAIVPLSVVAQIFSAGSFPKNSPGSALWASSPPAPGSRLSHVVTLNKGVSGIGISHSQRLPRRSPAARLQILSRAQRYIGIIAWTLLWRRAPSRPSAQPPPRRKRPRPLIVAAMVATRRRRRWRRPRLADFFTALVALVPSRAFASTPLKPAAPSTKRTILRSPVAAIPSSSAAIAGKRAMDALAAGPVRGLTNWPAAAYPPPWRSCRHRRGSSGSLPPSLSKKPGIPSHSRGETGDAIVSSVAGASGTLPKSGRSTRCPRGQNHRDWLLNLPNHPAGRRRCSDASNSPTTTAAHLGGDAAPDLPSRSRLLRPARFPKAGTRLEIQRPTPEPATSFLAPVAVESQSQTATVTSLDATLADQKADFLINCTGLKARLTGDRRLVGVRVVVTRPGDSTSASYRRRARQSTPCSTPSRGEAKSLLAAAATA